MHRRSALAIALVVLLAAAAPAFAAKRHSKPVKPQFAKTAVLEPKKGAVFFKERGGKRHRLRHATRVHMPVQMSATDGTTTVRTALPSGKVQFAHFRGAPFMLTQPRSEKGLTDLKLNADLRCGPGKVHGARRSSLFGSGHGRFRTRGRNSSATVRGTTWVTQDDCTGTQITSQRGQVQTQADGADLQQLLDPGESVTYYCSPRANPPGPGTYCTLVLSDPNHGLVGMGIIDITDETQYNLCLFYPDGTPDCGDLPLSDPIAPFGWRDSIVVCFVPLDGSYNVRWTVGGQALFPDLTTPRIPPNAQGYTGCTETHNTDLGSSSRPRPGSPPLARLGG